MDVGVAVGVDVDVGDAVDVAVDVDVGVAVGVAVDVAVAMDVSIGVSVIVGTGVFAATAVPPFSVSVPGIVPALKTRAVTRASDASLRIGNTLALGAIVTRSQLAE